LLECTWINIIIEHCLYATDKCEPWTSNLRESGKGGDLWGSEKRQVEGCCFHDNETFGLRENQDIS